MTALLVYWVLVVWPVAVALVVRIVVGRLALVDCCDRLVLSWVLLPSVTDGDKAVVEDLARVTMVEGDCEPPADCSVGIWLAPVDVTVVVGRSLVL